MQAGNQISSDLKFRLEIGGMLNSDWWSLESFGRKFRDENSIDFWGRFQSTHKRSSIICLPVINGLVVITESQFTFL